MDEAPIVSAFVPEGEKVTTALLWARYVSTLPRRSCAVDPRPSSRFLLFSDFVSSSPERGGEWTTADEAAFSRYAEARSELFRYQSTTLKRMLIGATLRKIAAGENMAAKFEQFYGEPLSECEHWAEVATAPSKLLLPELRRQVRSAFGVSMHSGGEPGWCVTASGVQVETTITCGGPYCQFAYHRVLRFADGSRSGRGATWEEDLGAAYPEWDIMTADSMVRDISALILFTKGLLTTLSKFFLALPLTGAASLP